MCYELSWFRYITNTPKKGWQNVNFLGEIKANFDCPVTWTTDVNGSAFGEYTMSMLANEHINSLVYYTIGTGVGAGVVINGKFLETQGHSEMGHVYLKRHPKDLNFKGICPYHGDCLEGLVAGPTFEARTGKTGKDVQINDPVWNIMSFYVAQAAIQTTLSFRPNKIIFGGGVVNELFLQKIRRDFAKLLNEYVSIPNLEKYITMPLMANNGSATLGNFALASKAYHS